MTPEPYQSQNSSGLNLHINRFHITNPAPGELLIRQGRSKSSSLFFIPLGFAIFAVLSALYFNGYVGNYKSVPGSGVGLFFPVFLFVISFLGFNRYFSKNQRWHFTQNQLFLKTPFGKLKCIQKDEIQSIYIEENIKVTEGMKHNTEFIVILKPKIEGKIYLMAMDRQFKNKTSFRSRIAGSKNERLNDAGHMVQIISAFWNIPIGK